MRINEMLKINELLQSESWKSFVENSDNVKSVSNYASYFASSSETIRDYSNLNSKINSFTFANNNLASYADSLGGIKTGYDEDYTESGLNSENSQTIDSFQIDRLKNHLSRFVNAYNSSLENSVSADAQSVSEKLGEIQINENLKNIGLNMNEDGTMSFDESKFDEEIKSEETNLSGIKSNLDDIKNLTSTASVAIKNISKDIEAVYSVEGEKLKELQTDFTTEQIDFLKNSLNSLFNSNSLNSMLAGLGIGRNLNEIL
ncbi:MAG TPA: hypothetical protein PKY81_05015 [bacterium]|nr:hypothetical protein [bacterium]